MFAEGVVIFWSSLTNFNNIILSVLDQIQIMVLKGLD